MRKFRLAPKYGRALQSVSISIVLQAYGNIKDHFLTKCKLKASATVAGLAAYLRSQNPDMTRQELRSQILNLGYARSTPEAGTAIFPKGIYNGVFPQQCNAAEVSAKGKRQATTGICTFPAPSGTHTLTFETGSPPGRTCTGNCGTLCTQTAFAQLRVKIVALVAAIQASMTRSILAVLRTLRTRTTLKAA
jgi:hypothetical protein